MTISDMISIRPTKWQQKLIDSDEPEVFFYGGAIGSGMTVGLLLDALQYVDVPEYRAVLFKPSWEKLILDPDSFVHYIKRWFYEGVRHEGYYWNEMDKLMTFPSGATLRFMYVDDLIDSYNLKGLYHYVGIDDVTDLTEEQYLILRRLAMTESDIPIKIRCAGTLFKNSVGYGWVKSRFIDTGKHILCCC